MTNAYARPIHLLCVLLTSAAILRAAEQAPAPFPPDPAHTNVTPFALAQAEQAPFGSDPMRIVRGEGAWQNTGPDPRVRDRKVVNRVPVSDVYPSWYILVWPEAIPLSALRLRTNTDQVKFYLFTGPEKESPALAPNSHWQRLRTELAPARGKERNESVYQMPIPAGTKARALKVQLLEVQPRNSKIAWISEFSVGDDRRPSRSRR